MISFVLVTILIITMKIINFKDLFVNENSKCHLPPENSKIKIRHLIITRFMMEFPDRKKFKKIMFTEDYIKNSIRVMKKYLFPSLENQSCKDFIWILKIGNDADIDHIKSLLNFNKKFKSNYIYEKDLKNYVRDSSKGYDILITTRIDYDDRIYYNAVNDARKQIDINKPVFLHGYNKGLYYFEGLDKYSIFYDDNDKGFMSIFISLIVNLKKVNDTINVYDLGLHGLVKKNLLEIYKSYGIKEINYDPGFADISGNKFIWVRQSYSGSFFKNEHYPKRKKLFDFNLTEFYGK